MTVGYIKKWLYLIIRKYIKNVINILKTCHETKLLQTYYHLLNFIILKFTIFKELNRKECYNCILNYISKFIIKSKEGGQNQGK